MKIEMNTSMAGADVSYVPGQVIEVSPEIGAAWIAAGIAGPADPTPETRVTAPAETTGRKRK